MKTKTKKILAFAAGMVLLVGVLWYASLFLGNPVSWLLARHTAQKRLAEQYPGTDYQIESVNYSFKDGSYHALVQSPSSGDTRFTFVMNGFGRCGYDSYEDAVQSGANTASRLSDEYRSMADAVLNAPNLPYKIWVGYGEIVNGKEEIMEEYDLPMLDTGTLELDGQYDVRQLGREYGKVVVCIEDDEITLERAAELVLDVKERLDKAGVPFHWMDFSLEYFRPEEGGGPMQPDRIDMVVVPYDEICEEDLLQKVQQWSEETEAFYAKMDAQKEEELAAAGEG